MKNREQWHKTICDIQLSVFFLCHSSFDKQCFSVVSWLIVAVSQYFVALHAQHFPSRFAYAQLEEKCWAFRQQNIVTRLQWALIQVRNIAYSHTEWQSKNSANISTTTVIIDDDDLSFRFRLSAATPGGAGIGRRAPSPSKGEISNSKTINNNFS